MEKMSQCRNVIGSKCRSEEQAQCVATKKRIWHDPSLTVDHESLSSIGLISTKHKVRESSEDVEKLLRE